MSAWRRAVVVAVAGAACALALTPVAQAGTSSQPTRLVTFVARTCPSYTDIAANRARNNIQESLQDLGADTPTTPATRSARPSSRPSSRTARRCRTGASRWARAYESRAVTGPWGALSVVTGPFAGDIVTKTSVPLLDRNGDDTGRDARRRRDGTADRGPDRAGREGQLAVGPGRHADRSRARTSSTRASSASARCAARSTSLNGDNVEWIGYPPARSTSSATPTTSSRRRRAARSSSARSWTTRPPPPRSRSASRATSPTPPTSTSRSRRRPASRARRPSTAPAGQTWSWRELDLPGWTTVGLSCTSATGASQTRTDVATGAVSVDLAAADTVTCTHTDRPVPPPGRLLLSKVTRGGIGSFDFDVSGPEQRRPDHRDDRAGHAGGG